MNWFSEHIVTVVLLIGGLLYALYLHMRGRVGSGDMAFMMVRIYPPGEDGKRRIDACTTQTTTLSIVVENLYLRLLILWAFCRSKYATLTISDQKLRRKILSQFRQHFSGILNAQQAAGWASREDDGEDKREFVFSLSDVESSNQRKIRAIAILKRDFEWVVKEGVSMIIFPKELAFMEGIIASMVFDRASLPEVYEFLNHAPADGARISTGG